MLFNHAVNAGSHLITEVEQYRSWLALGWIAHTVGVLLSSAW
jgi:hypothetical protein